MSAQSSLAWLDLNEEARQKMQDHLALLNEPDTVDQLGISQIRDVFSDLFFPGTSTLWRRARYMLFVPWIYRELEERGTKGLPGEIASRRRQTHLIRALKDGEGDDTNGLIGARTDEPLRMPDELIWNGLRRWGIRRRDGSRAKYWRMLETGDSSSFGVGRGDLDEALDAEAGSWWHLRLPFAPTGFLESITFELEHHEALFLRDQLAQDVPESLLARMTADPPLMPRGAFAWENPQALSRLTTEMQDAMDHARVFSFANRGMFLLYSYFVSHKRGAANVDHLAEELERWTDHLDNSGVREEIRDWGTRREAFWSLIKAQNARLRIGTEEFIDSWMAMSLSPARQLLESEDAKKLIADREWAVKRQFARLAGGKALDRARDESGTGQLDFRWSQGGQIITDIVEGLERGAR
jgi:hypothetical protein